jgi:hypothetical protein
MEIDVKMAFNALSFVEEALFSSLDNLACALFWTIPSRFNSMPNVSGFEICSHTNFTKRIIGSIKDRGKELGATVFDI